MSKPPRTRPLSAEEEALWSHMTRDVARRPPDRPLALDGTASGPIREEGMPEGTSAAKKLRSPVRPLSAPLPPERLETRIPDMTHGKAPGLDRRTATRMRRGKVAIDGRIDLHGMTREQARQALIRYLTTGYGQGRKAVLVITGKGTRLDGRIGVIREAVPGWLNAPPLKEIVRAFSYAAPQDGGEGALYVLLKSGGQQSGKRRP